MMINCTDIIYNNTNTSHEYKIYSTSKACVTFVVISILIIFFYYMNSSQENIDEAHKKYKGFKEDKECENYEQN